MTQLPLPVRMTQATVLAAESPLRADLTPVPVVASVHGHAQAWIAQTIDVVHKPGLASALPKSVLPQNGKDDAHV